MAKDKKPEPVECCVDCGAPEGEEHSADCPSLIEEEVVETPEPEGTEEVEGEPGQEESGDDPDEVKEESAPASDDGAEDCFGTFVDDDPECGNCDRVQECSEATSPPEAAEEESVDTDTFDETPEMKMGSTIKCLADDIRSLLTELIYNTD